MSGICDIGNIIREAHPVFRPFIQFRSICYNSFYIFDPMKGSFAKHTWLGFIRSPALTRKIIEGLFIGFFAIYTAVGLIALGFAAPSLIREFLPGEDPAGIVAGALCAYLLIDILMRYFLQKFPAMTIRPYLLLPIPKSKIVRFMLVRAFLNPFNLIIPLFLIPFYFSEIF